MKITCIITAVIFSTFYCSISAFANAILTLRPSGAGAWSLEATGLENISAVDVTITYDTSTLEKPKVVLGSKFSGFLLAANPTNAGSVRAAIVSGDKAVSGAGQVATVTFTSKGGASGKITGITAKLTNSALTMAPVIARFENPAALDPSTPATTTPQAEDQVPSSQTPDASTQVSPPSSTSSPVPIVGGTITMPADTPPPPEEKGAAPVPEQREEPKYDSPVIARDVTDSVTPEVKQQEAVPNVPELKFEAPKSILDRFRDFAGEKSSKALINLFTIDEKRGVEQVPPIFLSDGKDVVKAMIFNPAGSKAPNFALKKARLVSLKMTRDNKWVVEARPEKGVHEASVTMLVDDAAVEIPLTVAPKADVDLDKSGKVDEKDFKLFLKERGTEKLPRNDLNNDGRRDYIDDYIYTANYLIMQVKTKEKQLSDSSIGKQQKSDPGMRKK